MKVTVYELIKRSDASVSGVGNSVEVEETEAIKLIRAGTHKAELEVIGIVPSEWKEAEANKSGSKK